MYGQQSLESDMPWKHDRRLYLRLLADRLSELLEVASNADLWIAELSAEAESRGWVYSADYLRQDRYWVFAMDLFADNNIAFERLSDVGFELRHPDEIQELSEFSDLIV